MHSIRSFAQSTSMLTVGWTARWGFLGVLAGSVVGGAIGGVMAPAGFAQMLAPRIESFSSPEAPELSARPIAYRVSISVSGGMPEPVVDAVESSSNLLSLMDEAPPVAVGLIRRAQSDAGRIRDALGAFGYYDPDVVIMIDGVAVDAPDLRDRLSARTGTSAVPITITVDPGPQFILSVYDVVTTDGSPLPITIDRSSASFSTGAPARSETVLNAEQSVISQLRASGYALARVVDRDAVVDFDTREMEVVLTVDPGQRARVGPMTVTGLERVEEDFVQGRRPFQEGDLYTPDTVEDLRQSLSEAGVFSSIRIDPATELDDDGRLPLTVTVQERPARVIGFGGDFSTTDGFGVQAFWRHRNLFGRAEQFGISAAVGRLGQRDLERATYRLEATFRKPDFLTRDQSLLLDAGIVQDNPEAFDRRSATLAAGVERRFTDRLTISAGVSFEALQITDAQGIEREYGLIGVPLSLRYDTTNDLLDPTEGFRIATSLTPYLSLAGDASEFITSRTDASVYEDFGSDGSLVLAGRLGVGFIATNRDTVEIPANLRYFAGGGGSVRGYGYQSVGPRDARNRPLGGLSLLEGSLEARYRATDTIGIVPFVDAGMVFDSPYPDFDGDLQIGAGLGLRYYTGFGPIRADVAVPLNKRPGDDDFAFYISIGQSF